MRLSDADVDKVGVGPLGGLIVALDKLTGEENTVLSVITELKGQGKDLSGPCGAFEVTQRVAYKMGKKVLRKTAGNNCNGYAVDIVAEPDGSHHYDMLIDAGGMNGPAWQDKGPIDVNQLATSPYVPPSPDPNPNPEPGPTPKPTDDSLGEAITDLTASVAQLNQTISKGINVKFGA